MGCLKEIEPGKQLAIEIDHSAGHAKYLPDGLHVSNMNVKYGGKQKVLRDSIMTEGCLGPGEAKMYLDDGIRRRPHHERGGPEAEVGRCAEHVVWL